MVNGKELNGIVLKRIANTPVHSLFRLVLTDKGDSLMRKHLPPSTPIDDNARIKAILQSTEIEALYIKRPIMATHLVELFQCYVVEDTDWQKWYKNLLAVKLPKEFDRED